jgi:RNA polymerase sigma factor (sigma-70 family)
VPSGWDIPVLTKDSSASDDFDGLFTANYAALTRVIYRVAGDIGAAEELAAEAFWKLHRNPPGSNHNLVGWLYRTGIRLALDNLKKRNRRARYEGLAAPVKSARNPEESFARIEQQDRVRQVLAAIKPDQAALLALRAEGYNLGEIAARLNLNQSSVGTFLARADKAFRKEYVNRYGER